MTAASAPMVALASVMFLALSTMRAVGSRTSMSTTSAPASVSFSRSGSSSMA